MRLMISILCTLMIITFSSFERYPLDLNPVRSDSAIICGTLSGHYSRNTITLSLNERFVYRSLGAQTFIDSLTKNTKTFFFKIHVKDVGKVSLLVGDEVVLITEQYIERGDSIHILIDETVAPFKMQFSGRGAEKFNCKKALIQESRAQERISFAFNEKRSGKKMDAVVEMEQIFNRSDSVVYKLLIVLKKFKDKMSQTMADIIEAEIIGEAFKNKCLLIHYALDNADNEQRTRLRNLFYFKIYVSAPLLSEVAAYSDNYIEFLYRLCQQKLLLDSPSGTYTMPELFNLLTENYTGKMRERVLLFHLLRSQVGVIGTAYKWCLEQALTIVKNPEYRKYIHQQLAGMTMGVEAYDFVLPSVDSILISLKSLRGKVVLVDFWFTGCSACKALSTIMENEVIPLYSSTSVVFVSICLDKERGQWLKSLKAGGYSSDRSINLFTEGLAFDHPLVKFYNIQGCPFVMLIDREGKIISSTLARTAIEFRLGIDQALRKCPPNIEH